MQLNLTKIRNCNPTIVNSKPIKNIIFDFGGVICNIDFKITERLMIGLGFDSKDTDAPAKLKVLVSLLETGKVNPPEFRDEIRKFFPEPVTDEQLDHAWNALILDIPEPRIRLLEKIRKHYRIFLLSNTNEIHYLKYLDDFRNLYGYQDFEALFYKVYFSFRIGLHKPSAEIFDHVLRDAGLNPSETLFIDDTPVHVENARRLGIQGYYLRPDKGEQIMDLFTSE